MECDASYEHQKLLHEFEEISKQKESEHNKVIEEKDSQIHSYQLKVRMIVIIFLALLKTKTTASNQLLNYT